jgi:hypothetical protein
MKTKLMLGLAAVSLLASCGLIKTPEIELNNTLQDTNLVDPTGTVIGSGGALGIDGGKGAPLDLSRGGLTMQGANVDKPIFTKQGNDSTDAQLAANIARLFKWGVKQRIPKAELSGTNCPETFSITGNSFTLTVSDNPASGPRAVSQKVSVSDLTFKSRTASPCIYDVKATDGKVFDLDLVLAEADTKAFGKILLLDGTNTPNTFELKATYTSPDTVSNRQLTLFFGGSRSFIIANVL